MKVMTYSNARRNFRALIEKVNDDSEAIIVKSKNRKNAVIISEDDYNSIMETLYLTSTPANAKNIHQSISQLEDWDTIEVTLDDDK